MCSLSHPSVSQLKIRRKWTDSEEDPSIFRKTFPERRATQDAYGSGIVPAVPTRSNVMSNVQGSPELRVLDPAEVDFVFGGEKLVYPPPSCKNDPKEENGPGWGTIGVVLLALLFM